jgi:putative ABC transport system substrate-binding protein
MRRREFINGITCSAAGWPLIARAQQAAMPVIGYLSTRSSEDTTHLVAAFRSGLAQSGYVEGQSASIEYRWALGQYNRLPDLAAELVRRPVTVLVATGGEPAAFAATGATSTIPVVYLIGGDPVKEKLAASFAHQVVMLPASRCLQISWNQSDLAFCATSCRGRH